MYNNFYEQFLEAQKSRFDDWQKYMENFFGNFNKENMGDMSQSEYYDKMFEAGQEFWKKGFDEWKRQMQSAGQFSSMMGQFSFDPSEYYKNMSVSAQEFWKKVDESKSTYTALVELWRQLSEETAPSDRKGILEVYGKWSKECSKLIRSGLTPNVPEYIKEFSEKLMDYADLSGEKALDNLKIFINNSDNIQQAMEKMMIGSPNAYVEFMEVLRKNYDETFGHIANQPMFGKDMEFWRRYRDSFDRYMKFNIAAAEFYTAMYEVIRESTSKVVEEYIAMSADGEQLTTFDEFYKYWAKQVSATYDKVLFSEQYGQLAGNMIDEMSRFKLAYDELCEVYLAHLPIARKSDMDALHRTVYELKKEVRALKKDMKGSGKNEKGSD